VPLTDPGPTFAAGLRYGTVGAFHRLAPGSYAVSLRAAGAPRSTPPSLSTRVDIPPGAARTVAVTGGFADLALRVLTDDLSSPGPGAARVRVLSGAAGAPGAAFRTPDGRSAVPDDGQVVVPAGAGTVRVGTGARARGLPVRLAAGAVVDVVVLDAANGGLTVHVVTDAAGPPVVPGGPVEAGGGGTAGTPAAVLALALAGGVALAALGVRGRRRLVLLGAASLVLTMVQPATAAAPVAAPVAQADPARTIPAPTLSRAVDPTAPSVPPRRVILPSAGVDTSLVPIDLDRTGSLVPPPDPASAGWFRSGPAPGDLGPAVLAGHVDSTAGPGAFFRIGQVTVGDPVLVTRADGTTLRFRVTRVARYAKSAFPTAEVYGPVPDAELRLITCGGRFDRARRSYVDDVVVFAALR